MAAENISQISESVIIYGTLNFPGSVKIDGEVCGDIKVEGTLTIGKNAKVESNIQTKDVIILGYFKGEMHVSGQIKITSTGKFIGDLIQDNALLTIEKGGLFKGKSITDADKENSINTSEEEGDKSEHIQQNHNDNTYALADSIFNSNYNECFYRPV